MPASKLAGTTFAFCSFPLASAPAPPIVKPASERASPFIPTLAGAQPPAPQHPDLFLLLIFENMLNIYELIYIDMETILYVQYGSF